MLLAMTKASFDDDVFEEDETTKQLEMKLASMFGMEAGLFFPSGTMANQAAIKAHTQPLDEVILDKLAHIYNYETGAWAMLSGVSVRFTNGENGVMNVRDVEQCVLLDFDWHPNTRMVCIENSVNKGGGAVYKLENMKALSDFCRKSKLVFHCDGARIFNALLAEHLKPADVHGLFDSISICLSKGLGAPVGSVLVGKRDFIKKCRKIRKALGGGMRQSGVLAAAGLFALENNVERLADDHFHAKMISEALADCKMVNRVLPVKTNIVIAEADDAMLLFAMLLQHGIKAQPFSQTQIRFVMHLGASREMIEKACAAIKQL